MAVYTDVSDNEIAAFLTGYDVGGLIRKTPIAEGVENTNYKIETDAGPFILTLFEKRVDEADLPFFMALTMHLSGKGVPVAAPLADANGVIIKSLASRPAVLIRFLSGRPHMSPNANHCRALGGALANLHLNAEDFDQKRANPLAPAGWRALAKACRDQSDRCAGGLAKLIDDELAHITAHWPAALPSGVVHTDLFPDNVLFEGDEISGIIDFYFSCTDFFAYDLAVCVNAWCFDMDGGFLPENALALMSAYQERRKLDQREIDAFPILLRGAALRFLLTRLYDWLNQVEGAVVTVKDPLAFRAILNFHRGRYAPSLYGF